MHSFLFTALFFGLTAGPLAAREFHVATHGQDNNPGTQKAPLRTIQRAADLAQPGDTITVHAGTYRERVNPPRGGTSDRQRITYQAARGERVEIKGSEVIRGWTPVRDGVWKVTLPNDFFGSFNPYTNRLHGDWFNPEGRDHHTGAVYLNGDWLLEAASLAEVLETGAPASSGPPLWFAEVEAAHTTLWAQFRDADPNRELVEINVRQSVFYPGQPGRNFITVRGFILRHAATPWAPPTAEQVGLLGTHWSRGWIIEDNVISHSICSGITLGKYGDEFDNTAADTAEGYVKTIERAHAFRIPWTREHIGHHVVRNNRISHCEQAGIVGSLGGAFSRIEGNEIHDIHVRRRFGGAEMAGIKLHGAIDTVLRGNHVHHSHRGLWLDWMTQGTRVTGNLFHDNARDDLFVEVNHGPYVVDHNLFLSPTSLMDISQGGTFAHNLFAGSLVSAAELRRQTPFHPPHSTRIAGFSVTHGGDNRFFNNVFVGAGGRPAPANPNDERYGRTRGYGLAVYDQRELPLHTGGNVFYHGARPGRNETNAVVAERDPQVKLVRTPKGLTLQFQPGPELRQARTRLVTTEMLGHAAIPDLPFVNPDGSPLRLKTDFLGRKRSRTAPTPGPFEQPGPALPTLRVGPASKPR